MGNNESQKHDRAFMYAVFTPFEWNPGASPTKTTAPRASQRGGLGHVPSELCSMKMARS